MNDINKLKDLALTLNIELSDSQLKQFNTYYELLIEKNKVMNLTAITDFDQVITKHFIDSLTLVKAVPSEKLINGDINILDIGTGAGFPGIPLKIAFPDINITLLDSLNKRIDFLNEIIYRLDLNDRGNIKAVHSRAEDYIKEIGIRESFDIVVSRAVSNLSVLSEYCLPYTKIDGYFIPYKSNAAAEEIENAENSIKILGGQKENIISFSLPGNEDNSRTLVKIKKICSTPNKYPRKAGLPIKKPL